MNYTTKSAAPTAYITKRKSRLKIYDGNKLYLENGDNFEFEIHNPKQTSVLAKIRINGQYISAAGVVIKPGQRVFLERFLDSNNKFEFTTYEVENTSENRSAINLNGDVKIEFYDEQVIFNYPHLTGASWTNGWTNIGYNSTGDPSFRNLFTTTSFNGTSNPDKVLYESSISYERPKVRRIYGKKSKFETGRVEKGNESNQTLTTTYQNFNHNISSIVYYKILPLSTKNKEIGEIRNYCPKCGTKVKKNYKFCPSCGNKI